MRSIQRATEGAASVAGGRVPPDSVKDVFAMNFAVGNAIECNATSQREIFLAGHFASVPCKPQHYFFSDLLNRRGKIHMSDLDPRFWRTWRFAGQGMKPLVCHHLCTGEGEIVHIERE